jgi:hypothetical protein
MPISSHSRIYAVEACNTRFETEGLQREKNIKDIPKSALPILGQAG